MLESLELMNPIKYLKLKLKNGFIIHITIDLLKTSGISHILLTLRSLRYHIIACMSIIKITNNIFLNIN